MTGICQCRYLPMNDMQEGWQKGWIALATRFVGALPAK